MWRPLLHQLASDGGGFDASRRQERFSERASIDKGERNRTVSRSCGAVTGAWQTVDAEQLRADYEHFVEVEGVRLRRVLLARYGVTHGPDIAADVMIYAWEHWAELHGMANLSGYLYRVGQSAARRYRVSGRRTDWPLTHHPELQSAVAGRLEVHRALRRLKVHERAAVLLVHGYGFSYEEAAEALGLSPSTLNNHVHRGTAKLRRLLDKESD